MRDLEGVVIKAGDVVHLNYGIPPTIARLRISGKKRLRFECSNGLPRGGYLDELKESSGSMRIVGRYENDPELYIPVNTTSKVVNND